MVFLQRRIFQTEITGGALNRFKSNISREIRRNSFEEKDYPYDTQVLATAKGNFAEKTTKQISEVLRLYESDTELRSAFCKRRTRLLPRMLI